MRQADIRSSLYTSLAESSENEARIYRDLSDRVLQLTEQQRVRGKEFSLARAIGQMAVQKLDGLEYEVFTEIAEAAGGRLDPQRVPLRWSMLRDLQAQGAASAGGFLTSTTIPVDPLDFLASWSVTKRAGVMMISGLTANAMVATTATPPAGGWQATETTNFVPAVPVLGQLPGTPKHGGLFIAFSRQLAQQTDAERYVRRTFASALGRLLDAAVLRGSGASGEPLGVLGTAGVSVQSGTALTYAGALSMLRKVSDANGSDETIAFIGATSTREILQGRARLAAGGETIWDRGLIANQPAYATTTAGAASLICGDWSQAVVFLWGEGPRLEIDPFSGFKTASIAARLLSQADVRVTYPAAFTISTTVT